MNVLLLSTAASFGVFHTTIGVDHYIPFAVMSKANKWSFSKTMFVCTAIAVKGVNALPTKSLERYAHALAGFAIFICGLAVRFLGV